MPAAFSSVSARAYAACSSGAIANTPCVSERSSSGVSGVRTSSQMAESFWVTRSSGSGRAARLAGLLGLRMGLGSLVPRLAVPSGERLEMLLDALPHLGRRRQHLGSAISRIHERASPVVWDPRSPIFLLRPDLASPTPAGAA